MLTAMTPVFVDDVDAAVEQARVRAGGGVLVDPAADQPWGLWQAVVADPGRHLWELSGRLRDVAPVDVPQEGRRRSHAHVLTRPESAR
jgi:uncharacterized glyoxalase superfamily protein PhnB